MQRARTNGRRCGGRLPFLPLVVMVAVLMAWVTASTPVALDESLVSSSRSASSASRARWAWPLAAVSLVKPYAAPATEYGSGHRGIDLAATAGTAVSAPSDGVVWFVGVVVDRPVVTVDHGDGVLSSYEPVNSSLAVGDAVHRGDPLGVVGVGGHCSAACIHIGVRVDGEYVSPLLFFARVPRAVLLPLGRRTG